MSEYEPPRTSASRAASRHQAEHRSWYYRNRVDWPHSHHLTMRAVWYVCRYGHQDYEKVMRWSVRAIIRGAKHLQEFIKDENPTKGSGG